MHLQTQETQYKHAILLLLMCIGILLTRVPFLNAGYGSSNDYWRVAEAARSISLTGQYWASRTPPHPVQEIVDSLFWRGGPIALNGLTALLSMAAALFFALTIRLLGHKHYVLAGWAFALTPVVFVNSSNSGDEVWALAFMVAAVYFALRGMPLLAGILLGLAIGSRITSGALLLPLAMLLFERTPRDRRWKCIAHLCVATLATGALTFVPVFLKYGMNFFSLTAKEHPSLMGILKSGSVRVWGSIGLAAFLLLAIGSTIPQLKFRASETNWRLGLIWLIAIGLFTTSFLGLPYHDYYLIPVVPFVILVFAGLLRPAPFAFLCGALMVSPFVAITRTGLQPGLCFSDQRNRLELVEVGTRALQATRALPPGSVVVTGHLQFEIENLSSLGRAPTAAYVELVDMNDLAEFRAQGRNIFYLADQWQYEIDDEHIDLAREGATPVAY